MFQTVNWLCSHCHSDNFYCLSNAKGCYNLESCHSKIQPVAMKRINNWIRTLLFQQIMRQKWKLWHVWLHSFCCQFESQFLFYCKSNNGIDNLPIKFPNLSKQQQSPYLQGFLCQKEWFLKTENSVPMTAFYLEDKNICQSNKYYHNNFLNSLWNT